MKKIKVENVHQSYLGLIFVLFFFFYFTGRHKSLIHYYLNKIMLEKIGMLTYACNPRI